VQTIDHATESPSSWRKKKYAAGLVRTATTVATRARRRSCDASATDSSLERRVVLVGSAAVAIRLAV
jgi:hypothetical protein